MPTQRRGHKRGHGEGTIGQRPDGRWIAQVMVGYKPDGKKDVRTVYGKTRAECQAKLDELRKRATGGLLADADKERDTVATYLERWIETTRTSVRPKTHTRYAEIVRLHLAPGLGRHKLTALKPDYIQKVYAAKLDSGLAPRTVHHCHAVLHRALAMAVKWNYLPLNPCDRVDAPRVPRREIVPPTPAELGWLLDTAEAHEDALRGLWAVAIYSGCRLGEVLALQWQDVDLEHGTLTVRRTLVKTKAGMPEYGEPKSVQSRRTLKLPAMAMAALRAHRDRQTWARQALGDAWTDYGLVFCTRIGTAFLAGDVSHKFKRAAERAGLPKTLRFHDLRHASATLMLRAGIGMKTASARLGHSTITLTANTYQHVTQDLDADAADRLEAVMLAARETALSS